jgi:LCP family protein required for cell wall assembly
MLDELTITGSAVAGASKRRRTRRIVMIIVSLLLLLTVGTGTAYVAFLNHIVTTNVKHAALLPATSPGESAPARQPAAKDAQNILLIGSDSRGGVANGRSDVIVLIHISSDRQKVHLVHFPRDMYVDVPGHGKDKINAAFAYGGAPLLVRTMQNLVDVRLDHVFVIGFDGFKAMTDAVGGVNVYAEEASGGPGYNAVHVGWNHFDGKQALEFVRERMQLSEGDISRGRRQQAFIKALLLESLSMPTVTNPVRLAQLVDAATRNLTVDNAFTMASLRAEALELRNLRSKDIKFITAPITGFGTSPQGASIDVVDDAAMAKLSFAFENDDMSGIWIGKQIP